jgi:hypothetical protein
MALFKNPESTVSAAFMIQDMLGDLLNSLALSVKKESTTDVIIKVSFVNESIHFAF